MRRAMRKRAFCTCAYKMEDQLAVITQLISAFVYNTSNYGVQRRMTSVDNFFVFLGLLFFV